jgi:hypothetical protein
MFSRRCESNNIPWDAYDSLEDDLRTAGYEFEIPSIYSGNIDSFIYVDLHLRLSSSNSVLECQH